MGPLVAPAGTTSLIFVDPLALMAAWSPSMDTDVALARRLPTIVTVPPVGLDVGLNLEMAGPMCRIRSFPAAVTA